MVGNGGEIKGVPKIPLGKVGVTFEVVGSRGFRRGGSQGIWALRYCFNTGRGFPFKRNFGGAFCTLFQREGFGEKGPKVKGQDFKLGLRFNGGLKVPYIPGFVLSGKDEGL